MASRNFAGIGGFVNATQDATTLTNDGNFHVIFSMTLPRGIWLVNGYINATTAFNESFYCRMRKNTNTLCRENLDGRGGGGISLAAGVSSDGTAVIDLYAYQGSSSDKTIQGYLCAYRIA